MTLSFHGAPTRLPAVWPGATAATSRRRRCTRSWSRRAARASVRRSRRRQKRLQSSGRYSKGDREPFLARVDLRAFDIDTKEGSPR